MKFFKIIPLFCLLITNCSQQEKTMKTNANKIILIDPGHGGNDNGTSYENIKEDEINLKVGLFLYQILLENGFFTLITRNGDYDLSSLNAKNHKEQDLKNRVKIINDNKVSLFISLHLNSYLDTKVSGAQVFYQKSNLESKNFAQILQQELNQLYDKKRNIKIGNYYILEKSNYTGVLIEMGFLSCFNDREKLENENFQFNLAQKIFNCVKNYF